MKKTIFICIFALGAFLTINVSNSYAQTNKIRVGAALSYGTQSNSGVALGANGYYTVTDNIDVGADFKYYLGAPEHTTFWGINFNGHYRFDTEGEINPYALAGINITNWSVDIGPFGNAGGSKVGLNVGGGAEYPLDFGAVFGEAKYILSTYDQLVISAGVRFSL